MGEGGGDGWGGRGVVGGKCRQPNLNNSKIILKIEKWNNERNSK